MTMGLPIYFSTVNYLILYVEKRQTHPSCHTSLRYALFRMTMGVLIYFSTVNYLIPYVEKRQTHPSCHPERSIAQ